MNNLDEIKIDFPDHKQLDINIQNSGKELASVSSSGDISILVSLSELEEIYNEKNDNYDFTFFTFIRLLIEIQKLRGQLTGQSKTSY